VTAHDSEAKFEIDLNEVKVNEFRKAAALPPEAGV
jgi:hypothetical protein